MLTRALRGIVDAEDDYAEARLQMLKDLRKGYKLGTHGGSIGRGMNCMNGKAFIDTKVLIYPFDQTAGGYLPAYNFRISGQSGLDLSQKLRTAFTSVCISAGLEDAASACAAAFNRGRYRRRISHW